MTEALLVLLYLRHLLRTLTPTKTKFLAEGELAIPRWLKVRWKVTHERHD